MRYAIAAILLCCTLVTAQEIKRVTIEYADGSTQTISPATKPAEVPATIPLPPVILPATLPATLPAVASVLSLQVYDLTRNAPIATADNASKISVTISPGQRIYLYAKIAGETTTVDFAVNGAKWSEAAAPYTFGLQFNPKGWVPTPGNYTVTVTPLLSGVVQLAKTFSLTVSGVATPDYVKTDAGFTTLPLAPSAREIYASDAGNDQTGDGSQGKPYRTLQRAVKAVRNATGDRVRAAAGSTFYGSVDWRASGVAGGKAGILAYGDGPRPKIEVSDERGVFFGGNATAVVSQVAFVGLELHAAKRDPKSSDFDASDKLKLSHGFDFRTGRYSDILIEDCAISFFGYNIGAHPTNAAKKPSERLTIRRCIITDAWSTHIFGGQGVYCDNTLQLLIEETVFNNNGQLHSVKKTVPGTEYAHDMYLNEQSVNGIVQRNWIMGAANYGVQMRGGGLIAENIFFDNANHSMTCGAAGEARDNLYFGGHGIESGNNARAGYCGHTLASSTNALSGNWFIGEPADKAKWLQYPMPAIMLTRREWTPAGPVVMTTAKNNVVVFWPKLPAMQIWDTAKSLDKSDNPDIRQAVNVADVWPTAERVAVLLNRPMRQWYTGYTPAQVRAKLNESR